MSSNFDETINFLTALSKAVEIEEISKILSAKLKRFGVEVMIASFLPSSSRLSRFGRRELVMVEVPDEWRQRYISKRYASHDPIIRETLNRPVGFGWHDHDLPPATARGTRIMGEAAEFGLCEGFTVPLATIEGTQGGVTFAGRRLDSAPELRSVLTLVASYAFGYALLAQDRSASPGVPLSPREREVLQWAAEGKTDWEIGEIMRISEHGVDSHLRGVRSKLKAANRAQAVAHGIRRGLIQ